MHKNLPLPPHRTVQWGFGLWSKGQKWQLKNVLHWRVGEITREVQSNPRGCECSTGLNKMHSPETSMMVKGSIIIGGGGGECLHSAYCRAWIYQHGLEASLSVKGTMVEALSHTFTKTGNQLITQPLSSLQYSPWLTSCVGHYNVVSVVRKASTSRSCQSSNLCACARISDCNVTVSSRRLYFDLEFCPVWKLDLRTGQCP